MTNIAQVANVLQSMVLTKGDQMVLTPTYYVFKLYIPHQDGKLIPANVETPMRKVRDNREVPAVSVTASTRDGVTAISITNTDLTEEAQVNIDLSGIKATKVSGEILTAASADAYNDFGQPEKVSPREFKGAKLSSGKLTATLPSKSIVTLILK